MGVTSIEKINQFHNLLAMHTANLILFCLVLVNFSLGWDIQILSGGFSPINSKWTAIISVRSQDGTHSDCVEIGSCLQQHNVKII